MSLLFGGFWGLRLCGGGALMKVSRAAARACRGGGRPFPSSLSHTHIQTKRNNRSRRSASSTSPATSAVSVFVSGGRSAAAPAAAGPLPFRARSSAHSSTHTHKKNPKNKQPTTTNPTDVGRNYLTMARGAAKPTEKEIIIDVPAAIKLAFQGGAWPIAVFAELRAKTLTEKAENITVSPR